MRTLLIISVCLWGLAAPVAAGEEDHSSVAILEDGSITLPNNGEVPPYGKYGKWTEMEKKSGGHYSIRHFLFMVPNKPPALELFVTHDRSGDLADGIFEIGLVRGYVSGFASKAGFTSGGLVFEDLAIGSNQVKRSFIQLSKDQKKIWVYAYVYPRKPSLTFICVRAEPNARETIENYLATLQLK